MSMAKVRVQGFAISLDSSHVHSETMTHEFSLTDAVSLLSATPETLTQLLSDLPDVWISATEGEGTWSPYDVIGHLVHGERTDWTPRARHILAGESTPFETFDRTAQFKDSQGQTLGELLEMFTTLRRENVATLTKMNLTAEDLRRKGLHPALGEVTLGQLLATWVAHDLDHIAQIARTMAKVYRDAVGPWSAYLSILHDREKA
jgi:hypothetical protein